MVLFGDGMAGLFGLVRGGTIPSENSAIRISKYARLDTGITRPYFESVLPSSSYFRSFPRFFIAALSVGTSGKDGK